MDKPGPQAERVRGKTPARRTAAPKAARMHAHCTRDDTLTNSRPTHRWHDKRHGGVQRIDGHHGRVSIQTGCATPITADALTGPK